MANICGGQWSRLVKRLKYLIVVLSIGWSVFAAIQVSKLEAMSSIEMSSND
jgi:hypothetical protein